MKLFKKRQIKLSLIDDYVQILLIHNFLQNKFEKCEFDNDLIILLEELKQININLKSNYEKLIQFVKLDDISFLLLKRELKDNNHIFLLEKRNNFSFILKTIIIMKNKMLEISGNLNEKLKKLNIVQL